MNKWCMLSIQLVAGLVSVRALAATSWDIDNNRVSPSVYRGGVVADAQDGKDVSLTQRMASPKFGSEEAARQEGVGTAPFFALSAVVSSLSGNIPESVQQQAHDVNTAARAFTVCRADAEVAAPESQGKTGGVGVSASGAGHAKQAANGGRASSTTVSIKEDLKRYFGAGNSKMLKARALENGLAYKVTASRPTKRMR